MNIVDPFERSFSRRQMDGFVHRRQGGVYVGHERRRIPSEYVWDGLRRSAPGDAPRVLFQGTLAGAGRLRHGRREWTVPQETAFLVRVPSAHAYWLPAEAPDWTFFWIFVDHPVVVKRLTEAASGRPVFPLGGGSRLAAACAEFFGEVCRGDLEDGFAEEEALFRWMLALERHLHGLRAPVGDRPAMLDRLRLFTVRNLSRAFGIGEVAAGEGLTRSHYSHRFRAATGRAPAGYVLDIRLEEVRRHLRDTRLTLKEIAVATGFADANHLCKAFRRRHGTSPGAYRLRTSPGSRRDRPPG